MTWTPWRRDGAIRDRSDGQPCARARVRQATATLQCAPDGPAASAKPQMRLNRRYGRLIATRLVDFADVGVRHFFV